MIKDCLNPNCINHFAHLGSGEIYAVERPLQEFTEFFWMCAGCLPRFAVALSETGALTAVERRGKMHLPPPNRTFDVRIVFPNHTRQASAA